MTLPPVQPQNTLNKAFRKVKPNRADFETFKTQLENLTNSVKPHESEEFHKNLITAFLKKTYYDGYFINTKDRNDLVIHEGATAATPVGVIVETKKPGNKSEMPSPTDLNRKALHELVLYYLRERVTNKNLNLKHLVVTDTYQWFVFDASTFEKTFVENRAFVKTYEDFAAGRLTGTKTEFFYNNIAKPFIAQLDAPLPFTFVELRDYVGGLTDEDAEKRLITLYKLFSPEHLLKLPFANDSNTLDKAFYAELLHIVGLTEKKVGGKKLIVRQDEPDDASLLENAMIQLENLDKLSRLEQPAHYGDSRETRLFNVALELAITWVNRVLFLKLLESQLLSYHKHQKNVRDDYAFLNSKRLKDYDELNTLFFGVLAKPVNERHASVAAFRNVPYLNSSLFEPTELEHRTLAVSALRDDRELELYPGTVLKDADGKKRSGRISTLAYLFEFLDAYDFSSEGSEAVQEDDKRLINASVLGLIFEKINGYKDGSFFTPGFITMYMCRETIRSAVVQKFNSDKGWDCRTITELYNKIDDKQDANRIVDSLKICDPAVGSGHFLVSALNEIIALKSELKILMDDEGKVLRSYTLEVSNDELVITDDNGELFEYKPQNAESQRVQKTLFHEKQTLIENCLFGVDINPNSVKICRLRLWIELLKNAYYKPDGALETLPNIDINIKTGNSLISRYALDVDLKQALKKSGLSVEAYRNAVSTYRNAESKDVKREMEMLISEIKRAFRTEIMFNDRKLLRLNKLKADLSVEQEDLFADEAIRQQRAKQREKDLKELAKLEQEVADIQNNKVFENAFEWRFEFPEALNENGDFVGFDVVLGNPPYIRQEAISPLKAQLQERFETYHGSADLYVYFVELGVKLLSKRGKFSFIIANKWMRSSYGKPLRTWLKTKRLEQIIDYGDLPVFEEATTYPCILSVDKGEPSETLHVVKMEELAFDQLRDYVQTNRYEQTQAELDDEGWSLANQDVQKVLDKLNKVGVPLEEYVDGKIYFGIKTGLNAAFVIDSKTREKLIADDKNSAECIKLFPKGKAVTRYETPTSDQYLIFFPNGWTDFASKDVDNKWEWLEAQFPAIAAHLRPFEEDARKRTDRGAYWWELRSCSYYEEFEKPKIIYSSVSQHGDFTFDNSGIYFDKTCYFIGKDDKYLLGLLNSSTLFFHFASIGVERRGGYFEYLSQYVKQLPIRTIDFSNPADQTAHDRMTQMVDAMLDLHKQKAAASGDALAALEARIIKLDASIDTLVYALYGLSEEEIKIVEGSIS